jgi:hypothetical protein
VLGVPGPDQGQGGGAVHVLLAALRQQQSGGRVAHRVGHVDVETTGGVHHGGEAGQVDGDEVVGGDAELAQSAHGGLGPTQPGEGQPRAAAVGADHHVTGHGKGAGALGALVHHHDDVGPAPRHVLR